MRMKLQKQRSPAEVVNSVCMMCDRSRQSTFSSCVPVCSAPTCARLSTSPDPAPQGKHCEPQLHHRCESSAFPRVHEGMLENGDMAIWQIESGLGVQILQGKFPYPRHFPPSQKTTTVCFVQLWPRSSQFRSKSPSSSAKIILAQNRWKNARKRANVSRDLGSFHACK